MKKVTFILNGKSTSLEVDPEKPLLWVLQEDLGLTGTKYGCGMAICGCCTVHLEGDAIRSCVTPMSRVEGKRVIVPGYKLLKEWAYAGFLFVMSGAGVSHIASGDSVITIVPALILLTLIAVSWSFRPADRKITSEASIK